MSFNLDFEELFKISLACLKANGAHPDTKRDFKWMAFFFLEQGIYTFYLFLAVYTIIKHDIKDGEIDIVNLGINASFIIIYCIISFKYFILVYYQTSFVTMIKNVKDDYTRAKYYNPEEQEVLKTYAHKGRLMLVYWTILIMITGVGMLFGPLLLMLLFTIFSEFEYIPFVVLYPPPAFQGMNDLQLFIFTYCVGICFVIYSATVYLGVVPLGLIFMLHACGQLEVLKFKVMDLFPEDNKLTEDERAQRIKFIAQELQKVYDFVDLIKDAYKLMYELTLKGTSIIIPGLLLVFLETSRSGNYRFDFLFLLGGALLISSFPCYCGEMLIGKSDELRDAVYFCMWEGTWEHKTRRSILILQTRMQQSIAIRSVFMVICFESLAEVYSQAYTLFNLINASMN